MLNLVPFHNAEKTLADAEALLDRIKALEGVDKSAKILLEVVCQDILHAAGLIRAGLRGIYLEGRKP